MKKYIPDSSLYAPMGQRIKAWLVDAIVFMICLIALSYGGYEVVKQTPYFKAKSEEYTQTVDRLNLYAESALLAKKKSDGTYYSGDELRNEYLASQMLLSYDKDPNAFVTAGITDNPHDHAKIKDKYVSATVSTDTLAYFYVTYIPNLPTGCGQPDYKGKTPMQYYKYVLENNGSSIEFYNMGTGDDYPFVKSDFAINLYKYFCLNETSGDPLSAFNFIDAVYTNVMTDSCEALTKLTFYAEDKALYSAIGEQLAQVVNINYIVCYCILFAIYFVLIPILLKHQRTPLKLAFKLATFSDRNTKISWGQFALRCLFDLIFNSFIILPSVIFASGFSISTRTLFKIGNWSCSLTIFVLILLIPTLINLIYYGVKKNGQTLEDALTHTVTENCAELETDDGNEEVVELGQ